MQQCDSIRLRPLVRSPVINHHMRCLISTMHSNPLNVMSPCICNVMRHCMSMSCHICDECHMDNLIHTFYHVSWTIILHAYNLENKHSVQCQYISTHISTFIKQQLTTVSYRRNSDQWNFVDCRNKSWTSLHFISFSPTVS